MEAKKLTDLIEKYSGGETPPGPGTVSYSCKVSLEARAKLDVLAYHFGVKKTPLVSEILETAIGDLFEQIYDDLDENAQEGYAREMEDIQRQF